ncbi:MAG: transposase [Acidobacteria bacterium]|nr:transposase [Acidobacteriota bacterium]
MRTSASRFESSAKRQNLRLLAAHKIETLFSELRKQARLRKVRLRGLQNANEQFILAATAQNVKRLIRFLNQPSEAIAV